MSTLTQEEIDIFVKGFNAVSNSATKLYKPIDFRKPNKLQNENLGALKQINEHFVKALNKVLTMYLRTNIQIDLDFDDVEQVTYQQYINTTSKNSLFGVFSLSESNNELGKCVLQLKTDFCYFYIDKTSGGDFPFTPLDNTEVEEVSEIDKLVATGLFKKVVAIYEEVWNNANIGEFGMSLNLTEDNAQNLNLGIVNSEMMLVIPMYASIFQARNDDDDDDDDIYFVEQEVHKTMIKIGIPYSVIEPVLDNLNLSNLLSSGKSSEENKEIGLIVEKMHNVVECYVGETIHTFEELISLEEGDFISFEKGADDPVNVYVGGVKKFIANKYQFGRKNCLKIIKHEE